MSTWSHQIYLSLTDKPLYNCVYQLWFAALLHWTRSSLKASQWTLESQSWQGKFDEQGFGITEAVNIHANTPCKKWPGIEYKTSLHAASWNTNCNVYVITSILTKWVKAFPPCNYCLIFLIRCFNIILVGKFFNYN